MADIFENIGRFGFGLMRLPMIDGEIDIEQVKTMADMFMSAGFNYFDTAFAYNAGGSERALKAAVVDRYPRESFRVATKLAAFYSKTADEAKRQFDISLERTGAGYFDFYLLHNLGETYNHVYDSYGIWDYAADLKKQGLIRNLGFSFHDKAPVLDKLLTDHPDMDFVQLQVNYADWDSYSVQSRDCLEVARRHGKPVIVMEPVKGGILANPPEPAARLFKAAAANASCSSWAVRFAASQPGVKVVLSGMSDIAQMRDNLAYMRDFRPLSPDEARVIERAREEIAKIPSIQCTACGYCKAGCPAKIMIPNMLSELNTISVFGNMASAVRDYGFTIKKGGRAGDCIACGQCEEACPQHLSIIENIRKVSELFDK